MNYRTLVGCVCVCVCEAETKREKSLKENHEEFGTLD